MPGFWLHKSVKIFSIARDDKNKILMISYRPPGMFQSVVTVSLPYETDYVLKEHYERMRDWASTGVIS